MQVWAIIVDWKEVEIRWKKGKLSSEGSETFAEEIEGWNPSMRDYTLVVEAWELLNKELILRTPGISREAHRRAHQFMRRLFTWDEGLIQDLGDKGKRFVLSINPESSARLATIVKPVQFRVFEKAFRFRAEDDEDITQQLRVLLRESAKGRKPELCYREVFLPYVQTWVKALKLAAKRKKGILVAMD